MTSDCISVVQMISQAFKHIRRLSLEIYALCLPLLLYCVGYVFYIVAQTINFLWNVADTDRPLCSAQ